MRSRLLACGLQRWVAIGAVGVVVVCGVLAGSAWKAVAQEISPELLEQAARESGLSEAELLARYGSARADVAPDTVPGPGLAKLPPAPLVVLPLSNEPGTTPASNEVVESTVSSGATLFGSDFFHGDPSLFGADSFGPVPGDYLLGPGDQVTVDVWGEVEFRHERVVDRSGAIILPKAGRIPCANRTLDQVSQSIREAFSRSYSSIDPRGEGGRSFVEVSLGRLREIRVFVVGEVARPGGYELSSVATLFTALFAAGGPSSAGSLRNLRLMRDGEEVGELDLYNYLLSGDRSGDSILRAGDTVFVPARTMTVELRGAVRRPMAFELVEGEGLEELLHFAGGFETDANTGLIHVDRILPPGERKLDQPDRVRRDLNLPADLTLPLLDGDILTIDRIATKTLNWVEVRGNVKNPGRYEFRDGLTVDELVQRAGGVWKDTLFERAILDRVDEQGNYSTVDIVLGKALDPAGPGVRLQNRDTLRVFSSWDIRERSQVQITGEVRSPGTFDWREGMTLRDLVLKAGGLQLGADILHAEIARRVPVTADRRDTVDPPESVAEILEVELGEDWLESDGNFSLQAHDIVAIRRLPWWEDQRSVSIRGEVLYPGRYVLDAHDERLSSVVARAGGLKPTAYPDGARIVRSKDSVGNIALDLREALKHPEEENDAILNAGDEIVIPPMPYTVKVVGAVNFSTSVIWERGKGLGDYIRSAGGNARNADKWGSHVVYANGESRPIRRFWRDPEIRPGSTIVVPVKPPSTGDGKLGTLREITSIIASLAMVVLVINTTN